MVTLNFNHYISYFVMCLPDVFHLIIAKIVSEHIFFVMRKLALKMMFSGAFKIVWYFFSP